MAVVNETFVKRFLEGRNPIGVQFSGGGGPPDITIVGVVKDSHYSSVKDAAPPVYYRPWRQDKEINGLYFYVRTALPEKQMVPQIRRVMASLDRDLPVQDLRTLDEQIRRNIQTDRIVLQLAGRLRRAGHGAGDARTVWRHGALGDAAHAGNRHPHGAGRGAGKDPRHGDARAAVDSDRRVW